MKKIITIEKEIEVCDKCEKELQGINDTFDMDDGSRICGNCFRKLLKSSPSR